MRHFSPEPLPQLGWGQFHHAHCCEPYSWPSRAKAVANAPPGTLLHGQPPCRPAPTLRDETVARSMSGELAIILWAVSTPAGDRVPPSSPVLAPPHTPRKEAERRPPRGRPHISWGCHFPQARSPGPYLHLPDGRRVRATRRHSAPSWPRDLPAAVKPLAKAKASWPAPMKPTLMVSEARPRPSRPALEETGQDPAQEVRRAVRGGPLRRQPAPPAARHSRPNSAHGRQ